MKTYQIYDGEGGSLLSEYPEIEATSGKEAILIHLKKTGREYKIKRSSSNRVIFKAQAFEKIGDVKYRRGNAIWYEKI